MNLDLLPFPLRPHCDLPWCVVDEPDHDVHLSRAEGPQTIEHDKVTAAAYARAHRVAGADLVEFGIWSDEEGGRAALLSPDEAEHLAEALTRWATTCRTTGERS